MEKLTLIEMKQWTAYLLYFFLILDQDVVRLQLQCYYLEGQLVLASREDAQIEFDRNGKMD